MDSAAGANNFLSFPQSVKRQVESKLQGIGQKCPMRRSGTRTSGDTLEQCTNDQRDARALLASRSMEYSQAHLALHLPQGEHMDLTLQHKGVPLSEAPQRPSLQASGLPASVTFFKIPLHFYLFAHLRLSLWPSLAMPGWAPSAGLARCAERHPWLCSGCHHHPACAHASWYSSAAGVALCSKWGGCPPRLLITRAQHPGVPRATSRTRTTTHTTSPASTPAVAGICCPGLGACVACGREARMRKGCGHGCSA
eukprot:1158533-Pelagomonas_calceolata.AAC.12